MVQPLALILNERIVVGAQLEQKLEALDYRVEVCNEPARFPALAAELKPLVIFADIAKDSVLEVLTTLSEQPETRHVPVVGYAPDVRPDFQRCANSAGVSTVVPDSAVLQHLKPILDQVLHID